MGTTRGYRESPAGCRRRRHPLSRKMVDIFILTHWMEVLWVAEEVCSCVFAKKENFAFLEPRDGRPGAVLMARKKKLRPPPPTFLYLFHYFNTREYMKTARERERPTRTQRAKPQPHDDTYFRDSWEIRDFHYDDSRHAD